MNACKISGGETSKPVPGGDKILEVTLVLNHKVLAVQVDD